jgi:hypothetical protein
MGSSKGSSSSAPVVTQEQKDALAAQTKFLTGTAMPAYQKTIGTAGDVYGQTAPAATAAAQNASNVASQTGAVQQGVGTLGTVGGMAGLASLFGPQYEQGQVNAALQAGRESARESQAGQNAMYGGLGGARMALADKNLSSLNAQRQATAAAGAQAGVQANKAAAAGAMLNAGQAGLTGANQAAASQIGYAQTPQDVFGKYASVIFGTPQASTTPNFAGTQGSNTRGKSSGISL